LYLKSLIILAYGYAMVKAPFSSDHRR